MSIWRHLTHELRFPCSALLAVGLFAAAILGPIHHRNRELRTSCEHLQWELVELEQNNLTRAEFLVRLKEEPQLRASLVKTGELRIDSQSETIDVPDYLAIHPDAMLRADQELTTERPPQETASVPDWIDRCAETMATTPGLPVTLLALAFLILAAGTVSLPQFLQDSQRQIRSTIAATLQKRYFRHQAHAKPNPPHWNCEADEEQTKEADRVNN